MATAGDQSLLQGSNDSTKMTHVGHHQHSHGGDCCKGDNDVQNARKMPTIFEVVKSGMLVPVQTFVEAEGAEILKSKDDKGHYPAHWACLGGHATILRYIIENKGPIDEPSDNDLGQRPIHWACVNGHIAIVDILLQVGVALDVTDNKGCTPLIVACQYGKTMLAGYLMGKGSRLQIVDKDGDTALHWGAFKGHSELMRLLIYSGFNPHQRDNYGQTPLHLACINGSVTSVQELCEQDQVEIDIADKNGKTPLMLAVGRKHDDVIQYLKKQAKQRTNILPKFDMKTLLFGPPGNSKGPLLFFIVSMLFWAYPMYILKCLPTSWYELESLHLCFMALNVVMWACLYHACTVDPGFLPRNIPEYDRAIKEVAHFDEWKQGRNPLSRLCHTCRTVKPIRSKHCRTCNRCVETFDHHCPYIYNCVGVRNRVSFLTFVLCVSANGFMSYYFLYYIWWLEGARWYFIPSLFVGTFFQCVAFAVGSFTIYHMSINLTTNERINYRRYDYLKDGKGKYFNPFNRGIKNNILEFLKVKKPQDDDEVNFLNVTII